jgi:hypothetical protein
MHGKGDLIADKLIFSGSSVSVCCFSLVELQQL